MANAVINGVTWTDGATLSYITTGRYITDVRLGARRSETEEISAPGVDGYGTKDYGLREADIEIEAYYIDSSEANIITAWGADISGLPITFAVTIGGVSQGTCRILSEKSSLSQVRNCGRGAGIYRAAASITLRRLR